MDLSTAWYNLVIGPFIRSEEYKLSQKETEEIIESRNECSEVELLCFKIEMPTISRKVLVILLQFSITYLHESGFSPLMNIKTKKRETVVKEIWVVL